MLWVARPHIRKPFLHKRLYCELIKPSFKSNKVLLVDASPLLWYFFIGKHKEAHLKSPLSGKSVGALAGFITRLIKELKEHNPEFVAICLDHRKNLRKEFLPTYKQTRESMPEELKYQIQLLPDALHAMGIPFCSVENYEADDVIATYVRKSEENGHFVDVISPDKDLAQVVSPYTTVHRLNSKQHKVWNPSYVEEVWKVRPEQVPHVQSLCGDQSDNIKGVPGIGPKTAVQLIRQFGSVQNLLNNYDEIDAKYKDKIRSHANIIELNFQAARLRNDLDVPSLIELKRKPLNVEKAQTFLEAHGLGHLLKPLKVLSNINTDEQSKFSYFELREDMSPSEARDLIQKNMPGKATIVNDKESADHVLEILYKYKNRYHACDTEVIDINLNDHGPVGNGKVSCFSIYVGPDVDFGNGPRVYVENLAPYEGTIEFFKNYFEDKEIKKVWHNYGFDRHIINNHGIDVQGFGGDTMHMARLWDQSRGSYSLESLTREVLETRESKRGMMERFGVHKLKKDGTEAKMVILPPIQQIQRDPNTFLEWIDYSALDAEATWHLRESLNKKLIALPCSPDSNVTMWDFYQHYWLPFGELLTDMERRGIKVDVNYLKSLYNVALEDQNKIASEFLNWASKYCPDCKYMNYSSDAQKQQLLFAPTKNKQKGEELSEERTFKVTHLPKGPDIPKEITIKGFGLEYSEVTASGWPTVSSAVLKKLAGDPPNYYGDAKALFDKKGINGEEACHALASLVNAIAVETLITSFIQPLPELADKNDRIHCSLNLNTETGRLSARKPNLQNQPALEKDRYKIRKAFTCEPGNLLLVADYGQLELRLLAHMTNCKSMIDAFKSGGDFHSRTALGMYPHIRRELEEGKLLLEWDNAKGKRPDIPLLKDKYATERRRAKVLNFSIAYGKTDHGLAKDWNVSLSEARETLEAWYSDRPEVRLWQKEMISYAKKTGATRTLLGRYRQLTDINSSNKHIASHAARAAINTPLQGGAADIMVCCMLKIHNNQQLKELGWKQILQIHDELILEGPEETAKEAKKIVIELMENPLEEPLLIDLVVDAKLAKTWYEAK